MRTIYLIATVVVTLPSLGCLVPYAYPTLDCTQHVKLDCPPGEVHAFRVDVTGTVADLQRDGVACLTEIPVTQTEEVPAQLKPAVTYGYYVFGVAVNFPVETNHSVVLRLYRPGYQLVEIQSWETVDAIAWKPAADWVARREAIEALVRSAGPGSLSPANRAALLFAASEYERLATTAPEGKGISHLAYQARELRGRADK
jgi:hypothetical protein